jgi:hypothetical protein
VYLQRRAISCCTGREAHDAADFILESAHFVFYGTTCAVSGRNQFFFALSILFPFWCPACGYAPQAGTPQKSPTHRAFARFPMANRADN